MSTNDITNTPMLLHVDAVIQYPGLFEKPVRCHLRLYLAPQPGTRGTAFAAGEESAEAEEDR